MVTRQAVSRWENGETVPNTETLKLLSKEFDVSINTLLGTPRKLICQCCGMPLEDDEMIGRDRDGLINEDYWKRYDELSDHGQFEKFKKKLLKEINDLHIEGLPEITRLNALVGKYVNLEYPLPNGRNVKFLDDQTTYLGTQSESDFEGDRYFGVLAGMGFILICTYETDRTSPELVLYKKDKIGSFPAEDLSDFFQVLGKKDSLLPFFGRQSLFNHKIEKSFQVIIVTVQVIEDTGSIKLF